MRVHRLLLCLLLTGSCVETEAEAPLIPVVAIAPTNAPKRPPLSPSSVPNTSPTFAAPTPPGAALAPPAEHVLGGGINLSGLWTGPWGEDRVREVIVLSQDTPERLEGHSYFENERGDRYGEGVITGHFVEEKILFTLARDGMEFHWEGTFDINPRALRGTFRGYSNNALYIAASTSFTSQAP